MLRIEKVTKEHFEDALALVDRKDVKRCDKSWGEANYTVIHEFPKGKPFS